MLPDILFTLAALGFTYSVIPQMLKLKRVKDSTGVSLTRTRIIVACIVITIIACVLSNLLFSTVMNCIQLGFILIVMKQIKKYRR